MKIAKILIIAISLIASGCSTTSSIPKPGNPAWVNARIAQYQNAPVGNPPQSIWQYEYRGQTVYYIPPQCCDQFSQVYDSSGKIICAPDGGFTGAGDGKCSDFFKVAKKGVLIWKDSRSGLP